jgi:hypothetical protein
VVKIELGRSIARSISGNPGWSLVYGRRKVGKTYLIEHFVEHDAYFSVKPDLRIIARGITVEEMERPELLVRAVMRLLSEDKTVVVDEFQRLPSGLLADIAQAHPHGRLILTGSSMRVVGEVMGRRSPLLGLLRPFRVGLVSPTDLLASLCGTLRPEKCFEHAPLLRDPWTVPFFTPETFLADVTSMLPMVVPGIVGEIFTEDERELTRTYSSILSMIGAGTTDYREIASTLHDRGVIRTGSSANVLPYMRNLVEMGLLERVRTYGRKRYTYLIPSLPIRMFYYLDSRYDITEREVSFSEIAPTAEGLLRSGIEEFIVDLLTEHVGGRKERLKDSEREVDVLVTVRNKPALVGEVKWGRATRGDVTTFLEKVEDLRCRKVLFSLKPLDTDEVEVLLPSTLVDEVTGTRAH